MTDQLERLQQAQAARKENLAAWRSNRLVEETLPSGLKVFLRDVTLTDLMITGKLPPTITQEAAGVAENGEDSIDLKALMENSQEFGELLDMLVVMCVMEPPIAEQADDEHLGLNEISGNDKMYIFQWVNRESPAVQPFRNEGKPDPTGPGGAAVLGETQPDPAPADGMDKLAVGRSLRNDGLKTGGRRGKRRSHGPGRE